MDTTNEKASDKSYAELIQAILDEHETHAFNEGRSKTAKTNTAILQLSPSEQAALAMAMLRWCRHNRQREKQLDQKARRQNREQRYQILAVMTQLLSRKLPFTADDMVEFLAAFQTGRRWWRDIELMMDLLRNYLEYNPLTPELQDGIEQACNGLLEGLSVDDRKQVAQLKQLSPYRQKKILILKGEAWSNQAVQWLKALSEAERSPWLPLLEECAIAASPKPTAKWFKVAHAYRAAIGLEIFKQALLQWFPLVDPAQNRHQSDRNLYILKGLIWLCADQTDANLVHILTKMALSAYAKIPGRGPCCAKLGNVCIWALGQMPTPEAVAQLALLRVKIKIGTAPKGIERALTAAAEREGLSRNEVEELSVPTYGLTEVGLRCETLGNFTAELVVTGTSNTTLRWVKPDGKPQKSVPKVVKDKHAEDLKVLKQAAQDIQKMLPAQRDRIESLYLQQKNWNFATWQEYYLNHPLMGTLARRLLWQFESGPDAEEQHHAVGIWFNGQLVNLEGQPIHWLDDKTQVALWHPISTRLETIQAWRNWLLEHQIQQPFKQAHREIYRLTAAEESTRIYSNRFAAHILKQHQFNALCSQRGWKNQLRLVVDDHYPPARLLLPQWELRAEFWIEGIGNEMTDACTYLYLSTDQVRFYPLGAVENSAHAGGGGYFPDPYNRQDSESPPIPLEDIPAIVFTEVMRDVDLFVGVASIGNNPNWIDGEAEGRHDDYWQNYSFGELSSTAQTRRQVLATLIPRLKKIRDRCSLQDRFLAVKGDIRTYKIHLGSGNILMEPNDQYLCIIGSPRASDADKVFLPFEGDKTLALILSKAFLLADDIHITDPTILTQIKS